MTVAIAVPPGVTSISVGTTTFTATNGIIDVTSATSAQVKAIVAHIAALPPAINPVSPPFTILAAAGTTQATAPTTSAALTVVPVCASGAGIRLNPGSMTTMRVCNRGAAALLIYPPSSCQIEGAGSNTAYSLATGQDVTMLILSATQIYALLG